MVYVYLEEKMIWDYDGGNVIQGPSSNNSHELKSARSLGVVFVRFMITLCEGPSGDIWEKHHVHTWVEWRVPWQASPV